MPGAAEGEPGRTAARKRTLRLIQDLTLELHPEWQGMLQVGAESDLDQDLGYDSLARAELLLRLNRAFGIMLPDSLIVEAATAEDICTAVANAAPSVPLALGSGEIAPPRLTESPAPVGANTLLDVLAEHVGRHRDRPHIRLLQDETAEEVISYGALDAEARIVAQGLLEADVGPGDRVAIMLPTSRGFFQSFMGILVAGAVPVPIYPPLRRAMIEEHLRRQAGILRNAGAVLIVTDEATRPFGALLSGLAPDLRRVSTVAELAVGGTEIPRAFVPSPEDPALIQYTSGSTGDPKGVVLTHANLLANIRAMGAAMQASSRDSFVSWLPLYHDMGLIGAWLGCLYFAAPTTIMSPLKFIADPGRWLRAMHRQRATLSAAPNFAYELCLKRVTDDEIEGLDLSSVRMLINGAEPVSPTTLQRFGDRFARYGLAREALSPTYGLAENSVGLAFPPPGRGPVVDRIERAALAERGLARPAAADDPGALAVVACGRPIPGHQIRIVDDTGHEVEERHQGRLEFKGPSSTAGYFRSPEKTAALFDGDWLDSGDLGYVAEGDVYLTGRIKDVIIRAGRNVHPHELEECVGDVEGVRRGCVAVIAGSGPESGTERLVVVAETRTTDASERTELRRRILEASATVLEVPPDEIVLVPPHAVPKTSSGKIRRSATRELYQAGRLAKPGRALWWQLARLTWSRARRRARDGLLLVRDFAYAGWWWTVLGLVALVVWPLVILLPRREWRHVVLRHGARTLFALTGIRFDASLEAEVPQRGMIIVSNHTSYLDGAAISAAIPGPLTFIVTERFARQGIAGPFLRRLGAVFVGAGAGLRGAEQAMVTAVRAGERVVVFPEGRLRRMPGLLSFYPGPFVAASDAGVSVVPVALKGLRSVLRHSEQWFPRRAPVQVHVGRAILPEGKDFAAALALGRAARAAILAKAREPDLGREGIGFGRFDPH